MSYAAKDYPVNVCLICGGELELDEKRENYRCLECGEKFPTTMLNVTKQNFEDLESMR